jgi:hypothetical protein
MGYAYAVVDRHPSFEVPFFLLFFPAHERGNPSRRILGEPPGPAIVRRRGVAEIEWLQVGHLHA